jgi:hypothetical protein
MVRNVVHLPIVRYETPEGEFTCCLNVQTNEVCPFFVTMGLKQVDICSWAEMHGNEQGRYKGVLHRKVKDNGELGYIVPHKLCPLEGLT